MTLTSWGIEGLTFEIENGKKSFKPEIIFPTNTEGTINITKEYGFDTIFNLNENVDIENAKKPQYIVEFLEKSINNNDTAEANPVLKLTENESEVETTIMEKLSEYINPALKSFITGELDIESDWADYLTELENRGYKLIEDTWNRSWTRNDSDGS